MFPKTPRRNNLSLVKVLYKDSTYRLPASQSWQSAKRQCFFIWATIWFALQFIKYIYC
jgi:hypothetical protein